MTHSRKSILILAKPSYLPKFGILLSRFRARRFLPFRFLPFRFFSGKRSHRTPTFYWKILKFHSVQQSITFFNWAKISGKQIKSFFHAYATNWCIYTLITSRSLNSQRNTNTIYPPNIADKHSPQHLSTKKNTPQIYHPKNQINHPQASALQQPPRLHTAQFHSTHNSPMCRPSSVRGPQPHCRRCDPA